MLRATTALGGNTERLAQIAQAARAFMRSLFDVAFGDRITDADVHSLSPKQYGPQARGHPETGMGMVIIVIAWPARVKASWAGPSVNENGPRLRPMASSELLRGLFDAGSRVQLLGLFWRQRFENANHAYHAGSG